MGGSEGEWLKEALCNTAPASHAIPDPVAVLREKSRKS